MTGFGQISRKLPRLTGFSLPFGGVQWENRKTQETVAAELMVRLEDRRVLFNPSEAESPHHCVQSVLGIRQILTDALVQVDTESVLAVQLRSMGAIFRKFLDRIDSTNEDVPREMAMHGHWRAWQFQDALGQMRGAIGVHIAAMSENFKLSVDANLQSIMPIEPYEDEFNA